MEKLIVNELNFLFWIYTNSQNINLELQENKIFLLFGPSGGGKTTLLSKLCTGLLDVTEGRCIK